MILVLSSCNKLNPSSNNNTSYEGVFVGVGEGVGVLVGAGVGDGVPVGGNVWFFGTIINLLVICQDIP
jgi:hypothetical protein